MFNQYNPYMNYRMPTNKLSFSNILNNIQKFLNIANQALPVVKEVRPILKNARTFINVAKGFSKVNDIKEESPKKEPVNNNGLNFFV